MGSYSPPPPPPKPRAPFLTIRATLTVAAALVLIFGVWLWARQARTPVTVQPRAKAPVLAVSEPAVTSRPPVEKVWTQEPTSFKGVPFGATEREIERAISDRLPVGSESGLRCADLLKAVIKVRACWVGRSDALGDKYILYAGKLVQVDSDFAADDYPKMREAFIAKYGPPHKVDTSVLQNKMGAQFAQETLLWEGPDIHIFMLHYGDKVTEGVAFIGKADFAKRVQQATEEEKRKLRDSL